MIKPLLYDAIFGVPLDVATPNLYKKFLNNIDENSSVLEIGIGTGLTLERNADTILQKNIKIHGIDIDSTYLNSCQLRVEKSGLDQNVTLELNDVLDACILHETYDYALFMESFPVINKSNLELIIKRVQKILKPNGKIVFIHNLVEEEEWSLGRALLKMNLKKVTTVEFGRLIVRSNFEKWCLKTGLRLDSIQMIGELKLPIPGLRSVRQYMYFWSIS